VNLWCDVHRRNHRFTPSAVERIVYALQTMVLDVERDGPLPLSGEPQMVCLDEALRSAGSVEAYREHVDGLSERRMGAERLRKPQLRGRPS
jgi:hypothetical protein